MLSDNSDATVNMRAGVGAGRMQATHIDPVMQRIPMLPEDSEQGFHPRSVIRPTYARYYLNRVGGATLDVVAPNVKTPWPGPKNTGMRTWLPAKPPTVNQVHKTGLSTQAFPGPQDLLAMQTYQSTWSTLRARLSSVIQSLNGG